MDWLNDIFKELKIENFNEEGLKHFNLLMYYNA
jgi:hypothetical protein